MPGRAGGAAAPLAQTKRGQVSLPPLAKNRSAPALPARARSELAALRVGHLARHKTERVRKRVAQRPHSGDRGDADQRSDKAIFDRGRAGFIPDEALQHFHGNFPARGATDSWPEAADLSITPESCVKRQIIFCDDLAPAHRRAQDRPRPATFLTILSFSFCTLTNLTLRRRNTKPKGQNLPNFFDKFAIHPNSIHDRIGI